MIYAIGDIHGRYDLLVAALNRIAETEKNGGTLIFLGDYVDRGPNSREVIRAVMALDRYKKVEGFDSFWDNWNIVCLKGNHEEMMVSAYYGTDHGMWAANGGAQTLESYGTEDISDVPQGHIDWMNSLSLYHVEKLHFFCHAKPDYDNPIEEQVEDILLWSRYTKEPDDLYLSKYYVVHGHTPVREPVVRAFRCDIDTGAVFKGGFLTVALFEEDKHQPVTLWRFE